jgi:hypothetical protein
MSTINHEDLRCMSMEELRKLYDQTHQNPRAHESIIHEIEWRLLEEIGSQAKNLANSVTALDRSVQDLVGSSRRMERFTKWLITLTVILTIITAVMLIPVIPQIISYLRMLLGR